MGYTPQGRVQGDVTVGGGIGVECQHLVADHDVVHRIQAQIALDPEHVILVGHIRNRDAPAVNAQVIDEGGRFKRLYGTQGHHARGVGIGQVAGTVVPPDVDLAEAIG